MEVSAKYVTDTKFEVSARDHRLVCDQPHDNAGTDEGVSPPELLLASLATCAAYYAAQYLKARSLPSGDLNVRVKAEKLTHPARLGSFRIGIELTGLEARHQLGIRRAVETCLIHSTLLNAPDIEISVDTDAPVTHAPLAA